MEIRNPSPALWNEDLAPAKDRRWGVFSIFNVWTSDVHSLWGYYLAASLFLLCGTFLNFILAIGIGSLVIFVLMNLIGYAGVRRLNQQVMMDHSLKELGRSVAVLAPDGRPKLAEALRERRQ